MKFSKNWLQEYIVEQLSDNKTLEKELNSKAFEVEEITDYISEDGKYSDTIFDIKILPNRAHDALGHLGLARELATILDFKLNKEKIEKEISSGYQKDSDIKKVEVEVVDAKACSRFMSVRIDGVMVEQSPEWLKNKLESIGQKSINNIVDITNYVQFTLNKPMHAYDARDIEEKIVVRFAKDGEMLDTLDDKNLELNSKTLVIADNKKPLGLAGIKGGKYSGIKSDTTSIIIESANFNPVLIRKTSQKYNLKTDASKRFENGISDELVAEGLYMTINEIKKLFPNAKVSEVTDTNSNQKSPYYVGVTLEEINNVLGSNYDQSDVENILKRFNFKYEKISTLNFIRDNIEKVLGAEYKNPSSMRIDAPKYFSCSSLVSYLYRGVWMPSLSVDKYVFCKKISKEELQYGDLIFANSGEGKIRYESVEYMPGTKVEEGIDHVGIYIGNNEVLHATKLEGKTLIQTLEDFAKPRKIVGYDRVCDNLDEERYVIEIPHERLDLRIKEDMIEEIGRVIGYDNLIPTLPKLEKLGKINKRLYYQNIVRNILNKRGFSEVMNYSLSSEGEIKLSKSASDKTKLRSTIGEGLAEAMNKNIYNMPLLHVAEVRMYEFGNVFRIDKENENQVVEINYLSIGVDDGKKKSDYAALVDQLLIEIKQALGVEQIVYSDRNLKPYAIGINFDHLIQDLPEPLQNVYLEGFENNHTKYKPFSQMPFIVRDVAFWCDEGVDKLEILGLIKENAGDLCISVSTFDEFIKDGKKSLGYRLIYQADDRTLTDDEVNGYAENVYKVLKEKGFEIR